MHRMGLEDLSGRSKVDGTVAGYSRHKSVVQQTDILKMNEQNVQSISLKVELKSKFFI